MLVLCRVGHASQPIASIVSTKSKKTGQKMRPASVPNDCVVNVTQTQVSEGPHSQSASSVTAGKEVKGMDQTEDEQLSPLQLRIHQMEDKTICHILGWKNDIRINK